MYQVDVVYRDGRIRHYSTSRTGLSDFIQEVIKDIEINPRHSNPPTKFKLTFTYGEEDLEIDLAYGFLKYFWRNRIAFSIHASGQKNEIVCCSAIVTVLAPAVNRLLCSSILDVKESISPFQARESERNGDWKLPCYWDGALVSSLSGSFHQCLKTIIHQWMTKLVLLDRLRDEMRLWAESCAHLGVSVTKRESTQLFIELRGSAGGDYYFTYEIMAALVYGKTSLIIIAYAPP